MKHPDFPLPGPEATAAIRRPAPLSRDGKIECRGVWKHFGEGAARTTALQDIDLSIADNEFVTFVGASGCGKSTLLRTLAGLETHDCGEVLVDGQRITGPGRERAMVFQHYSLYPWLSVTGNIKFC